MSQPRWLVAISLFLFAPSLGAAPAPAKRDACVMEPGAPRPAGCAPWSGRRTTAQRAKPAAERVEAPKAPPLREQDFRAPKLERRSRALLIQELTRLEQLFRNTPEDSPERARLLLRLADTFAELARVSEIEKLEAAERARAAKQLRAEKKRKRAEDKPSKEPQVE